VLHLLEKNLGFTPEEITRLQLGQQPTNSTTTFVRNRHDGCWMDRMADAVAIIVVDALRFDFALEHLPKSVGSRITQRSLEGGVDTTTAANTRRLGSKSKLVKFVADPPTVTMQRLKGLTTGGLPAFADISNSFGGATVDEDTWILQLKNAIHRRQNAGNNTGGISTYMAFVGDDTWVDLFPNLFHDCHPFPSFNTRDLDTVDNGCLQHIPRLFNHFGPYDKDKKILKPLHHIARYDSKKLLKEKEDANYYTTSTTVVQHLSDKDYFELIVVHFLGVDHVGHTYGPNNIHMIEKLSQMDEVLTEILKRIDSAVNTCEVAFILGDHGMTKDGNHGGGTEDETNAGLFAQFSPGCPEASVRS
jgi:phosphatidylinositol glycan class O